MQAELLHTLTLLEAPPAGAWEGMLLGLAAQGLCRALQCCCGHLSVASRARRSCGRCAGVARAGTWS
jgi:hypothetical protein